MFSVYLMASDTSCVLVIDNPQEMCSILPSKVSGWRESGI